MPPRNPSSNSISQYGRQGNSSKRHNEQVAAGEREAEKKIERLRALRLAQEARNAEAASPPLVEEARTQTEAPATRPPEEPQ